jgi:hypothetical protein
LSQVQRGNIIFVNSQRGKPHRDISTSDSRLSTCHFQTPSAETTGFRHDGDKNSMIIQRDISILPIPETPLVDFTYTQSDHHATAQGGKLKMPIPGFHHTTRVLSPIPQCSSSITKEKRLFVSPRFSSEACHQKGPLLVGPLQISHSPEIMI